MIFASEEEAPKGEGAQYRYIKVDGLHAPLHLAVSITGDDRTGYDVIVRFLHQSEYDATRYTSFMSKTRPLHYASGSPSVIFARLLDTLNKADYHFANELDKGVMLAGVNPFKEETLDAFADYVSSR